MILKRFHIILLICSLSLGGMTSCSKYEEGPVFSFITKKERMSNIWKISYFEDFENSGVYNLELFQDNDVILTIEKNGKTRLSVDQPDGTEVIYRGSWHFANRERELVWKWDEEIPVYAPIFNSRPRYNILALWEDHVHLVSEDGRFRMHLAQY